MDSPRLLRMQSIFHVKKTHTQRIRVGLGLILGTSAEIGTHENCFRQISDKSNYCDIACFHNIPRHHVISGRVSKQTEFFRLLIKTQRQW